MRGEDVVQQDDREEDMQSCHEDAAGCRAQGVAEAAVPCASPGENLTAGSNDAGGALMTFDVPGSAWTEECHNG